MLSRAFALFSFAVCCCFGTSTAAEEDVTIFVVGPNGIHWSNSDSYSLDISSTPGVEGPTSIGYTMNLLFNRGTGVTNKDFFFFGSIDENDFDEISNFIGEEVLHGFTIQLMPSSTSVTRETVIERHSDAIYEFSKTGDPDILVQYAQDLGKSMEGGTILVTFSTNQRPVAVLWSSCRLVLHRIERMLPVVEGVSPDVAFSVIYRVLIKSVEGLHHPDGDAAKSIAEDYARLPDLHHKTVLDEALKNAGIAPEK